LPVAKPYSDVESEYIDRARDLYAKRRGLEIECRTELDLS